MMKRIHLYVSWLIAYLYVLAKYSLLDTQSKFDGPATTLLLSVFYFIPIFLFTVSTYVMLKASDEKKWVVPVMGVLFTQMLPVFVTWIGFEIVRFQYDELEPFIPEYFYELNNGYLHAKAEDFRVEYLIVFILNLAAIFIFMYKKIQSMVYKRKDQ